MKHIPLIKSYESHFTGTSDAEENKTLDKLMSACDRLCMSEHDDELKKTVDEIRMHIGTVDSLLFKTRMLISTAIQIAESDMPSETLVKLLDVAKVIINAERGFIAIYGAHSISADIFESEILDSISDKAEREFTSELTKLANINKIEIHHNPGEGTQSIENLQIPESMLNSSIIVQPIDINIHGKRDTIGVIYLDARSRHHIFSEDDWALLHSMSTLAALSIRNIRLSSTLRLSYMETVYALAKALEARDPYTHGHSERVATYSERCAKRLDLPKEKQDALYSAAILHDIGKVGIRDEVLHKPSQLTDEEYEHIKSHAEISDTILRGLTLFDDEMEILNHHHERYDGKGYPKGLKGHEISLEASIIQVADAWDAMTSKRNYSDAMDIENASRQLRENAGTQFNPDVVELFITMIEEEGLISVPG